MGKLGLVLRSTGSWYDVRCLDSGKEYRGRLRGKLKLKGFKLTNPIAVGDYVYFEVEDIEEKTVRILDIKERDNYLIRQSTRQRYSGHIIAANVDQAYVMATLTLPRTSLGFIDRFLVSATSSDIPAGILFNKADLLDEEALEYLQEIRDLYEGLGYNTLLTSALEDESQEEVKSMLEGKKTLLAGHSGVGKSTLVNALAPQIKQKTSEVSSFAKKGVHTTTFAEMFEISHDTFIIDTPGIKELGIIGLEENQMGFYFPEIRERASECKYYNCTHIHEPGCKVIEAVDAGEVAVSRYNSYLSILENYDNRR